MSTTQQIRFRGKVEIRGTHDCWPWTGVVVNKARPYGRFWMGDALRMQIASRAVFLIFGIDIPEGHHACHHCDNPICVNPRHIFFGTNSANMLDCYGKGRFNKETLGRNNSVKTHCPRGHAYDATNTTINGKGQRICRACRLIRNRGRYPDAARRAGGKEAT